MNDAPEGIYVGTAGWEYADWKGVVYPEKWTGGTKPLPLLCQWFDLVEINVTFYRPVMARQCVSWLAQTAANPRFMFCAKAPAVLTHERKKKPDVGAADAFRRSMEPLREADKLGAVLAQFPWSFKRTQENRQYLARLAETLDGLPLAVEMRHDSWDHPEFLAGLSERDITFCNIDQPSLNGCLKPSAYVTAPTGYIRLHGRNQKHWFGKESSRDARYDYLYTRDDLAPWVARIMDMREKVKRLFVVTNNHYRGQAVANALQIQGALGIRRVAPPETLRYLYPVLD
ncbi:MAG TPA: DUF72 domain-containing protein [Candidatus Hydrogenedentes bacterium]|nr:DUF72 domain-containing protein [Candidatus Hydrogenedentota bacterium]